MPAFGQCFRIISSKALSIMLAVGFSPVGGDFQNASEEDVQVVTEAYSFSV